MEHIVFSQIMNQLDNHKILVEFQHGFHLGHSCEGQLLNTVEDLSPRIDRWHNTNLLILDFSKAFDTVLHGRLLHKLQLYGVTGKTNEWIKSWLCQRQQRVVLDGSTSSDSEVLSGIPQGTVLGPLMFLLYVNDIGNNVSPQTSVKLFADDCLLYRTINSAPDEEQLQQDLNTMVEWSNTWLMRFNAAKCHLLTRQRKPLPTKYSINNIQLQEVSHHPYLGEDLSFDLSWKAYISSITSKAKGILNLLRWHLYGCKQEVKSQAFTSLVNPVLEYSSSVWDPHFKQDILAVEKIQLKGAWFATGNYLYQESVTSMLDDPHINYGENKKKLLTFYKATNKLSPIIIPEYVKLSSGSTRTHDLAYVQLQTNQEQYKISFFPRTIREWNSLPPDLVHAASVDDFTARLQSYTF